MPNYYDDAPDGLTPDETVTLEVEMDAPQLDTTLVGVSKHEAHFYGKDSVLLPYPRGARVGVREPWVAFPNLDCHPHPWCLHVNGAHTMPDKAIRHWYTVTNVNVVQRDGQWVEKVTMRRET